MSEKEEKNFEKIEREMAFRLRDVLLGKSWTVPQEEWFGNYHSFFMDQAEEVADVLQLPYVPLAFDQKAKTYTIEPKFLEAADPKELQSYRDLLVARFDMFYNDPNTTDEEARARYALRSFDAEGNIIYPSAVTPNLPHCVKAQEYADFLVAGLLGKPKKTDSGSDSFGFIENRQRIFFQNLAAECERYQLPRFVVRFTPEGIPLFEATEAEIAQMQKLLRLRTQEAQEELEAIQNEFEEYKEEFRELEKSEFREGDDDDDDDLAEYDQEAETRKKFYEYTGMVDTMWEDFHITWEDDNINYEFPSAIQSYSCEVLDSFFFSLDMMSPQNDMIGKKDRFVRPDEKKGKMRVEKVQYGFEEEAALDENVKKSEGGYFIDAEGKKVRLIYGDVNNAIPKIMFN